MTTPLFSLAYPLFHRKSSLLFFIFSSFPFLSLLCSASYYYPRCTELAFKSNGQLDIQTMLYNCSDYIAGNTIPPSAYLSTNGIYEPMNVSVQICLNNLISVDDLNNQLTIDFFFRLRWTDPRWNISNEMWNYLNPKTATSDGLNIIDYVDNQNELNIWRPDITFQSVNNKEILIESFKMFPNNQFYWARHMVATFTQPSMNYQNYPSDTQNFSIVIQSWGYSSYFIKLKYLNNQPVTYVSNYQSNDGQTNLEQNQIWNYQGYVAYIEDILQPNFANPDRKFSMIFVNLIFQRQSSGVITRLIVPLALLLLLSALTYWITFENRVETTITVLVSVSALYIIILQNIPLVGYLTDADRFIFWMFLLLILVISSHQVYATLREKTDRWPLRILYLRILEVIGRISVPLTIILYFQSTIKYITDPTSEVFLFIVLIISAILLGIRESFGIKASFRMTVIKLLDKINDHHCKLNDLSNIEIIFLNFLLFHKYSLSPIELSKLLFIKNQEKKKIFYFNEKENQILLKNVYTLNTLVGKSGGDNDSNMNSNSDHRKGSVGQIGLHKRSKSSIDQSDNNNHKNDNNMNFVDATIELSTFSHTAGNGNVLLGDNNISHNESSVNTHPLTVNPLMYSTDRDSMIDRNSLFDTTKVDSDDEVEDV